jgi:hypothetical protein
LDGSSTKDKAAGLKTHHYMDRTNGPLARPEVRPKAMAQSDYLIPPATAKVSPVIYFESEEAK